MARIDKTESAVGMTRNPLGWAADAVTGELDKPIGVGINSLGLEVKGAGTTGIVGVAVRSKIFRRKGDVAEHMSLGEIVECEGLEAGKGVYADAATGELSHTDTGTRVGYTVEADRLVVRL